MGRGDEAAGAAYVRAFGWARAVARHAAASALASGRIRAARAASAVGGAAALAFGARPVSPSGRGGAPESASCVAMPSATRTSALAETRRRRLSLALVRRRP